MRLHRSISPDRPLLVVALEEVATVLVDLDMPILVTGAGKVNAAVAVATTIGELRPHSLINLGTAGALRPGLTGSHVIARVTQHDLDDAALFSLTGLHFGEPIDVATSGLTLATGDAFIADPAVRDRLAQHADLVDMEAYAIARAATAARLPITIVKQVSDEASSEAATSWIESVDACAQKLAAWARENIAR